MIAFVGSKMAYVSFLQKYSLTPKPRHVFRFDQLQQGMTVMYDKSERQHPVWGPLIDLATEPSRYEREKYYNPTESKGYGVHDYYYSPKEWSRVRRTGNPIATTLPPNCLWCGKEFQTDGERDTHEESCGG